MKLAHYIRVRVIASPEDDKEKIEDKLISLFPFNLEEEKIELQGKKAQGFNERELKILEVELKKATHMTKFLNNLTSKLNDEQKKLILRQLDSRMDEGGHLYLRLDKERFLNDEYFITDYGNCFHITIAIAAFPAKKENAKKVVEDIFS
jgi:RNA binding exosome subunit